MTLNISSHSGSLNKIRHIQWKDTFCPQFLIFKRDLNLLNHWKEKEMKSSPWIYPWRPRMKDRIMSLLFLASDPRVSGPQGPDITAAWEANTATGARNSFHNKNKSPNSRKQLRSFARSLYCDNLSGSNLEIMNYISRKSCSLLISGSGTRFVVYETCENRVITLYKSIRALRLCTMCFPKQIKWCLR